jgi:plastocyanin
MTTIIKLRNSNQPGRIPTTGQLEFGEAGLNTADGKLFYKTGTFSNTQSFGVTTDAFTSQNYEVVGNDRSGPIVGQDVGITIYQGDTLNIENLASSHPLYIKTAAIDGLTDQVPNATGQGAVGGSVVSWTPTIDQVGTYYYQCSNHLLMSGIITVLAANSGGPTYSEQIEELSPHADDLLTLIKTVDGATSGLDADLLDGQEGTYYLDYNNFTNTPASAAGLTLTLSGKVTGNAFSNTGVMTVATELANTGVTSGTYGSASLVPIITIDEDGRITAANTTSVAGVSDVHWYSANNTFVIQTADGGVFRTPINEFKDLVVEDLTANSINITSSITVEDITVDDIIVNDSITANTISANNASITNNITVGGTVDGRDISADGVILDGLAAATTTVNLTGDIEGSATSNSSGIIAITTELTDTGVISGTYGSASQIPIISVDVDGRVTALSNTAVAGVDNFTYDSANNRLTIETGDGSSFAVDIDEFLSDITIGGNANLNMSANSDIIMAGFSTVDGRDVSVDGAKLDNIESGATADQTPSELLTAIKTVDGTTSGLDADLLDGLHASDILSQAANSAAAGVGNGEINITANNGLIGTITFNLNDVADQSIVFEHADTSAQASVDNADGNVIQDVGLDTYGHITSLVSTNLDDRYYTETESDTLFVTKTTQIIAGDGLSGGGALSSNVTISHGNTSDQGNTAFSNTEIIASLDVDDFGHVTAVTKQVSGFITVPQGDARYVNVTGDTMTGALEVQADIIQLASKIVSFESQFSGTNPVLIYSWTAADFTGAELTFVAHNVAKTETMMTKLHIVHDGSTPVAAEYGTVWTGSGYDSFGEFDVNIAVGNVQLFITPSAATTRNFKISGTLFE